LMFFMVVIETVRIVIRPLTLAVRLSANIMAGHVILGLISSVSFYRTYRFVFRALVQIIFFILELSVALIQPYVFFTLISLYKSELN
jgi:F-type H+-transporting ATPase subunit a